MRCYVKILVRNKAGCNANISSELQATPHDYYRYSVHSASVTYVTSMVRLMCQLLDLVMCIVQLLSCVQAMFSCCKAVALHSASNRIC